MAISVPENRIGELTRRQAARRRAVGESAEAVSRRGCARSRRPSIRRRARSPCASRIVDARSRGAMGHDRERRRARRTATPNAALLPLTSIYQKDGKPAVWRFDPATRQVSLAPVDHRPVSRGRRGRDVAACATATGSSPPACTSCCPGRWCGRTKAARRRRTSPPARRRRRRQRAQLIDALTASSDDAREPAGGPPRARASTCPNGRCAHRSLVLYLILVFALVGRARRTSGSGSPRIRRSRSR